MDSNDNDLFEDDGLAFDDPIERPTDDLPTDADSLYSLMRDLTDYILELEWEAAVYSQYASGRLHRTHVHRAQVAKALGVPAANDALEAGRRQFAEGFTNDEAPDVPFWRRPRAGPSENGSQADVSKVAGGGRAKRKCASHQAGLYIHPRADPAARRTPH